MTFTAPWAGERRITLYRPGEAGLVKEVATLQAALRAAQDRIEELEGRSIIDESTMAVKMEPCCECGEDYPASDLQERGEIYCQRCRDTA